MCSDKKAGGDSWSKIYFKHLLRTNPITIDDIAATLEVGSASEGPSTTIRMGVSSSSCFSDGMNEVTEEGVVRDCDMVS